MTPRTERRLLQLCVGLAGIVPVAAGLAGMLLGPAAVAPAGDVSLDSHFRYLSGLLCGIGLGFWSLIPTIERQGIAVRLLAVPVILGGAARLVAAYTVGMPSLPMLLAIGMELVVTPLLWAWQRRVARRFAAS